MVAPQKIQMQVEISYEQLLGLVKNLERGQKLALFENLQMQAFQENWFRLGEEIPQAGLSDEEIMAVMRDMRAHEVDMLTLGQYLQPSRSHLPVLRYAHPDVFKQLEAYGYEIGFKHVAAGAMVRSSYHADQQSLGALASGRPV